MGTKIWGFVVSILGVLSLGAAVFYVNTGDGVKHLEMLLAGGILGAAAFFTGIWMMPNKSRV
jgi:hypothetical protein